MDEKKKNILLIILGVLLIAAIVVIIVLINTKKDVLKKLNGTVIATGSNYVLIKGATEDYVIKDVTGDYSLGDEVEFSYLESNVDSLTDPKTIMVNDEKLIRTFNTASDSDEEKENNTDNTQNSNNEASGSGTNNNAPTNPDSSNNVSNSGNTVTNVPQTGTSADEEVMTYVNDLKSKFDSGSVTDSLKSGFVTVVDFLFYNGTIKGHTFSELSNSAKLKVLSLGLYFDSKIDKYFPGYKETISTGASKIYTGVKSKIVSTYLNLTTKICSSNADLCETAKNNFKELKTNFGLTWSLIKDIAGDGLDNIKKWYEIWSGK